MGKRKKKTTEADDSEIQKIHDVDTEIEESVLTLTNEYPIYGELWIPHVLNKRGIRISPEEVGMILRLHNFNPYDIILETIIEITKSGKQFPTVAPGTLHLTKQNASFLPPDRFNIAWEVYGVMMAAFDDIQLNWIATWMEKINRQRKQKFYDEISKKS
jgi:hypothetical protein